MCAPPLSSLPPQPSLTVFGTQRCTEPQLKLGLEQAAMRAGQQSWPFTPIEQRCLSSLPCPGAWPGTRDGSLNPSRQRPPSRWLADRPPWLATSKASWCWPWRVLDSALAVPQGAHFRHFCSRAWMILMQICPLCRFWTSQNRQSSPNLHKDHPQARAEMTQIRTLGHRQAARNSALAEVPKSANSGHFWCRAWMIPMQI